jgi:hypothetical protein
MAVLVASMLTVIVSVNPAPVMYPEDMVIRIIFYLAAVIAIILIIYSILIRRKKGVNKESGLGVTEKKSIYQHPLFEILINVISCITIFILALFASDLRFRIFAGIISLVLFLLIIYLSRNWIKERQTKIKSAS